MQRIKNAEQYFYLDFNDHLSIYYIELTTEEFACNAVKEEMESLQLLSR